MAQIPALLQLCAEQVAEHAKTNRKVREHLKHLQLPKVKISYIKNTSYKTCDFGRFVEKGMRSSTIIPSAVKMCKNYDFKISVGSEKTMYISTLGSLGIDPLKLDFPMGEYRLFPFDDGYILKTNDYLPKIQDAIHIFETRNDEKGLGGTYHQDNIEDLYRVQIFNRYISEHLLDNEWWQHNMNLQSRRVVDVINGFNNIPVLFYLTQNISLEDISEITLTCASEINNCGNVEVCWYVLHSYKGRIGIAVKQSELFGMLFDLAGIGLFASSGCRAIGNFDTDFEYTPADNVNEKIFERHHFYQCEYNPCSCDFSYKSIEERMFFGQMFPPCVKTRIISNIVNHKMSIRAAIISEM